MCKVSCYPTLTNKNLVTNTVLFIIMLMTTMATMMVAITCAAQFIKPSAC